MYVLLHSIIKLRRQTAADILQTPDKSMWKDGMDLRIVRW
jgi:hypothetical protein